MDEAQVNILEIKGYRAIQTERPLILVKSSVILPSFIFHPENSAVLHVTLIKIVIHLTSPAAATISHLL